MVNSLSSSYVLQHDYITMTRHATVFVNQEDSSQKTYLHQTELVSLEENPYCYTLDSDKKLIKQAISFNDFAQKKLSQLPHSGILPVDVLQLSNKDQGDNESFHIVFDQPVKGSLQSHQFELFEEEEIKSCGRNPLYEFSKEFAVYAATSTHRKYLEVLESPEAEKPFSLEHYFNREKREFSSDNCLTERCLNVLILFQGKRLSLSGPESVEVRRELQIPCSENKFLDLDRVDIVIDHAVYDLELPLKSAVNLSDSNAICASSSAEVREQIPVEPTRTKITVKHDAGYGNSLSICGTGPGMSWERGIPLTNIGADTWICELSSDDFKNFEFKIVKNDKQFEAGFNHSIDCGENTEITPVFN